ncbi:MAG: DUF2075 domain-containing protein [Coriobacteriales bacterium]|jgi:DUF2075 family protein
MLVYTGTKSSFMRDVENDDIAPIIEKNVLQKMHRKTNAPEFRSWQNSMQYMYKVVNDADIPDDCGVAIEYNVPLTDKRVDFILSGLDGDGRENADIIELKQWESAEAVPGMEAVVRTYVGGARREVTHPSYQAWSYAALIADFNESVQDRQIALHPCAFAHNYEVDGTSALEAEQYEPYLEMAPLFGRHDLRKLREFIKRDIKRGDGQRVLADIDNGKIRPSKSLQDALASMMRGNAEFTLVDTQKVFFEKALWYARASQADGRKRVYIVRGGPGTGKSVIAVNLLVRLIQEGQLAAYVSKNSAPRNVYAAELKGTRRKSDVDALFKGSGAFVNTEPNTYGTLVVDEAHRLNERSGLYGNVGENQVGEIIRSARCSVFFIDESQRVTIKDIGTVDEIRRWAQAEGAEVYEDALESQFRCNGSDGYLAWLDNTLQIRSTANWDIEAIQYDFRVMDSPEQLEREIRRRNVRNKARIVAGYCWEWPAVSRNDASRKDIRIEDWSISWNLSGSNTFAIDPESVNEAGCIHTTQGLEFDYVGVIVGPDMRFEDGRVVCDASRRAKTDKSLSGIKKLAREDPERAHRVADEVIKNTYRTLMTRGMKGCYVYCTDKPLADYLRRSMGRAAF